MPEKPRLNRACKLIIVMASVVFVLSILQSGFQYIGWQSITSKTPPGSTLVAETFSSLPIFLQVLFWFVTGLLAHLIWALLLYGLLSHALRHSDHYRHSISLHLLWQLCGWFIVFYLNTLFFTYSQALGHLQINLVQTAIFSLSVLVLFGLCLWFVIRRPVFGLSTMALLAVAAGLYYLQPTQSVNLSTSGNQKNIVLISIDSLRLEYLDTESPQDSLIPAINQFVSQARHHTNATTVVARTYPAYMSLYTGRYPHRSGARVNLQDSRPVLDTQTLLPEKLQSLGYTTIYATDEARFSNVDDEYGFDHTAMPPLGVTDFLLGYISDIALINLLVNTPYIKQAWPWLHANRAVAYSYRPHTFDHELRETINDAISASPDKPLFINVHYCLAHWPYFNNLDNQHMPDENQQLMQHMDGQTRNYMSSLRAVDQQVGDLLDYLEKAGVLHNSQIFMVSDHGESLVADEADYLNSEGHHFGIGRASGHGYDLTSQYQHQILMADQIYTDGRPGPKRTSTLPVELIDVHANILETVDYPFEQESIDAVVFENNHADRIRVRENGVVLNSLLQGKLDITEVAGEGLKLYSLSDQTKLVIKDDWLRSLLEMKNRAIEQHGLLLTRMNAGSQINQPGGWYIFDTQSLQWWRYDEFPDAQVSSQLMTAFCTTFSDDEFLTDIDAECADKSESGYRYSGVQ